MKTVAKKLDLFLELALMDKQFALIVLENENQKNTLKDHLNRKVSSLMETEKLEDLKKCKTSTVLFTLTRTNLKELMEWMERILPVFNQYRVVAGTSDESRMIFLLDKDFFESLPEKEQARLLGAFLPIFDFTNV